jgi:hypothetical protein
MAGPRYFGFVIGGSLPAALAANWLAGAWDQCPGLFVASPIGTVLEEISLRWLLDALKLPADCGGSFVTGATMAFRSQYKNLILPTPDELPIIHDGWIALAIAAVADVTPITEPLIKYRQHRRQQVGAPVTRPQRLGPLQAIGGGLRRTTSYADLLLTLTTLRQRLTEHRESFDCRAGLSSVENYERHINARSNLGSGRLGRLPTIFREVMGLRYHRYSRGFSSAVKDFVS